MTDKTQNIIAEVKKAVVGKDDIIKKTLMTILSKGHLLIEDIPGVGKTTMALAFSKVMALDYKRVQFTPDTMPSDITGFSIFNKTTGQFEFREGAAMCHLFLADEINRTSSKTQSALLELMEEHKVTVDGVTHDLPWPHFVIATQNPAGSAGTQLLPESQLDRFMVRLSMGYPDLESETRMLSEKHDHNPLDDVQGVVNTQDILAMQDEVEKIHETNEIYDYIAHITKATRESEMIKLGASPRGSIALSRMAAANAYLEGRDYVTPEDVQAVVVDTLAHRLVLSTQAKLAGKDAVAVLKQIVSEVPVPKI